MKKIIKKIYSYLKINNKLVSFFLVFIFVSLLLAPKPVAAVDIKKNILLGVGWVFYIIASFVSKLLAWMLGWLAVVASWDNFTNVQAVTEGWVQVRNLANMFFILILLVIAFATILRIEDYNVKRWLPKVIIMAILINFSKTICGIIIEFSQVIMGTFVNVLPKPGQSVDLLGIDKMWEFVKDPNAATDNDISTATVAGILMALVASLIALVVVVTAMAIFIIRIVMLWIYIVLSPLAYVMAAFPQGQKYASQWWGDFTKYVITGPVLAFFLWLALRTASGSATSLTSGVAQPPGVFSHFMQNGIFQTYLITIGFLVGGLMVTQQIGGLAASAAGKGMGAIQKGKGMAYKGTKRATVGTAKVAGGVALGAAGATMRFKAKEGGGRQKLGQFATNWRNDIKAGRLEAKTSKRLATLKKMGMKDKSMASLKDVADSRMGRSVKTVAKAGAAIGVAAMGAPAIVPAAAGVYAAVQHFRTRGKNKADKDKKTVDEAKERREERVSRANKTFDNTTGVYRERKDAKISDAQKERNTALKDLKTQFNQGNLTKQNYDNHVNSVNRAYSLKESRANTEYKNEKEVKDAAKALKDELAEAGNEFRKSVAKSGIEQKRDKAIRGINKKYSVVDGKTGDPGQQKKYDEKLATINTKHDKRYKNDYHPNEVTIKAAEKGIKDITQAKQRVKLLSSDTRVEDFDKGAFYSASGQNATQKKFFDQLTNNSDDSTKAIEKMTASLSALQEKIKNGDKVPKGQLASIQSLKQGIAAYKKGSGDVGSLSGVINIVNNIHTGDGSDPKHTSSVEDFESKVV